MNPRLLSWLLDSDPALRWQVERDLMRAPAEKWEATRGLVAKEGFGGESLSKQASDGQWAGGAYFPAGYFGSPEAKEPGQPWTATTWTLKDLREWGLDAALLEGTPPDPRLASAVELVRAARQPDGTWVQGKRLAGRTWFEVDAPEGSPSRWLTLIGTRVLSWWDAAHPS